jgi:ERCC4-type nuclease
MYRVIRDSREQKGWDFPANKYCSGTIEKALDTGDYSLEGLENRFCIERKGSISELAGNLFEDRFAREIQRLAELEHPYLVLEFELSDVMGFPTTSTIPRYRWSKLKASPAFILMRLNEYMTMGIHVVFVGRHGEEFATSLFKRLCTR